MSKISIAMSKAWTKLYIHIKSFETSFIGATKRLKTDSVQRNMGPKNIFFL